MSIENNEVKNITIEGGMDGVMDYLNDASNILYAEDVKRGDIRIQGNFVSYDQIKESVNMVMDQLVLEGMNIVDFKFNLTFQDQVPHVVAERERRIIIDRAQFDTVTEFKYVKDLGLKRILEHINSKLYDDMTKDEAIEFDEKFIELFNQWDNDVKVIPDEYDDVDIHEDPDDINRYFRKNNLYYDMRSIGHGKQKHFQIVYQSFMAY